MYFSLMHELWKILLSQGLKLLGWLWYVMPHLENINKKNDLKWNKPEDFCLNQKFLHIYKLHSISTTA